MNNVTDNINTHFKNITSIDNIKLPSKENKRYDKTGRQRL